MRLGEGEVRLHPVQRRVRAMFAGTVVVDTEAAQLVYVAGRNVPRYAFPLDDINDDVLVDSDHVEVDPVLGPAGYWSVRAGGRGAANAVWRYPEATSPTELAAMAMIDWNAMDAWFEEDDQVFVHPRDPFVRVDVLASRRHVEVEVEGEVVASSKRPMALFETNLVTRWYLPKLDVRMDLLSPTDSATSCPYKGTANYWTVQAGGREHTDLAWEYEAPLAAVARIANHVCFPNERVDLRIDGALQPRPKTAFG